MMEQQSQNQIIGQDSLEGAFYAEPQRIQCLNFLLHLAPYSDGLLLVSGEEGSGKSTLVSQFLAKAGDNWRVCLMEAKQLETLPVFLRELQQGFGFSLHGAHDRSAKVHALLDHLQMLQKRGSRSILILDDAHLLAEDIADFLSGILSALKGEKGRLCLILIADGSFLTRPWFESLKQFGIHSFALTPLSFDETVGYARHYLHSAGMPVESLPQSQIKKIFKQARGNLGQISRLIQASVLPKPGAKDFEAQLKMTKNGNVQIKKPMKLSKILFGILTVLLGVALYFEDEINKYFEPTQQQVVLSQTEPDTDKTVDLVSPPQIQLIEELTEEPEMIQREDEEIPPVAVPQSDAAVSEASEDIVVDEMDAELASEKVEPEAAPVAEKRVSSAQAPGVIRRESWILEQNPDHYLLQIMSFTQEMGIAKTLENIQTKEKFSYYKYKKNGTTWYRLAYGVYPDRKTAQAEVSKGLPKELGKVAPWIRRLGDVQEEITSQN
jgi:DamX protein